MQTTWMLEMFHPTTSQMRYKSGTVLNIFHHMNDECPFVSKNQNLSERDEGKFCLTAISSCVQIGQISYTGNMEQGPSISFSTSVFLTFICTESPIYQPLGHCTEIQLFEILVLGGVPGNIDHKPRWISIDPADKSRPKPAIQ